MAIIRRVLGDPTGRIGLLLVGALVLTAIIGPWLVPGDPIAQDIANRLAAPAEAGYVLGTDVLGRDLLSRLVDGARLSLLVALPSVAVAVVVGLLLGVAGGYLGGVVDNSVVTLADAIQAFPALIVAIAVLAALGPDASTGNIVVVIGFAFAPNYIRMSRALVLNIRQRPFVVAQQALGATTARIIWKHILPNILPPLLVLIAVNISTAIVLEAALSFLGLGIQPPTPSWGVVLFEGFPVIRQSPWPVIWSAFAIMTATFGFTLVGESLRDAVDPRGGPHRRTIAL